MLRLSLCLIARDEEAFLPGCLESVAGVVDEVVVVDTGSRDRTPSIAREAGAVVVAHAWQDDFAAARNAALAACSGTWILVLDADERLAPGAGAALRAAVERDTLDCGLLPLHNASRSDAEPAEILSGAARRGEAILLPRLFRRTPDLRWEGVVHESVGPWLAAAPRRVEAVDAPVLHYGDVPEVRQARDKAARNRRLLESRCQQAPGDVAGLTWLAVERLRAGDLPGYRDALERAWRAMERRGEGRLPPPVVNLAVMRAGEHLAQGAAAAALQVLAQARAWHQGDEHPNLCLMEGRARLALAAGQPRGPARDEELVAAWGAFSRCLDLAGDTWTEEVIAGATTWEARTGRGVARLRLGDGAGALEDLELALGGRPDHEPARLARVEALIVAGQPARALAEVEPLLRGRGPDAWVLAAEALVALGRGDAEVTALLRVALSRRGAGFTSGHRARRLVELGQDRGLERAAAAS